MSALYLISFINFTFYNCSKRYNTKDNCCVKGKTFKLWV